MQLVPVTTQVLSSIGSIVNLAEGYGFSRGTLVSSVNNAMCITTLEFRISKVTEQ